MALVKNIILYSILFLSLTFFFILYILGAAHYVTDFEENTCDMTYMFEYPQYVRIALDDEIEAKYPRFTLYAYGEGFVTEKLRRMHFSGIPVLFIPGHAGSHEQVRSLASVSLRKSLKHRIPFHFDYFTVSLDDYSAFYGGVLMEETEYVSQCIKRILQLYKGNIDNVILIGHSMGGVVAKGALLLVPNANASVATIIFNLATPHKPSLVLDNTFASYYRRLSSKLDQLKDAGTTVVSISGGPRDVLVTAAQTVDPTAHINVLSTNIPDVWKSCDHLSILWCKQLILAIVRSLFDAVDLTQKPPRISSDADYRLQTMSYHFLHRNAGKRMHRYREKLQFETNGEWIEDIRKQYVWDSKINAPRKSSPIYLMIRLREQMDHLTIETLNLATKDWLFICSATMIIGHSRACEWGSNLTNRTKLMPDSLYRLRKTVDLNLQEMKYPGMTHIIVRILADDLEQHVIVNVDLYSPESRTILIEREISFFKSSLSLSTSSIVKFDGGKIRQYAMLGANQDVVTVELKTIKCINQKASAATVELVEPWNPGATQIHLFTDIDKGPRTIRVQTRLRNVGSPAYLKMSLNPGCSYTFNIQSNGILNQMSCIVRDRWPILYTIAMSVLLLLISLRIDQGPERLPSVIVTLVLCLTYGLLLETCVVLVLLGILAISTCCAVIFFGSVAHNIAVRFLTRVIAFSTTCAEWLIGGIQQRPSLAMIFLMSLIPMTCGALAMLSSVFLYFLRLTKIYEDYLEELLLLSLQHFNLPGRFRSRRSNEDKDKNEDTRERILNQLLLFLLWLFTAIPAVPSVLVWAKNFSYNIKLSTEDPILLGSWAVLVAYGTIGRINLSFTSSGYKARILASILRFVSWIMLLTAATQHSSFYQWCIPPTVAIIVAALNILS